MPRVSPRGVAAEAAKHFHGTPSERYELALRLGRDAVRWFLTTMPPGTTEDEAREILRRSKRYGRTSSRVLEGHVK